MYWSWQDPVALGLAVAGIVLAFWLRRRIGSAQGCAGCASSKKKPAKG
jgi:hypothetical protein